MSSTVRRVIERRTGRELAVKIIDVSNEHISDSEAQDLLVATHREVDILRQLQDHPFISILLPLFFSSSFKSYINAYLLNNYLYSVI